jgi:hypothetical protein
MTVAPDGGFEFVQAKKKPPGVSPAVFGDSWRCLLGVRAGLSGRWAVGEPKVRKINGARNHGRECITPH